MKLKKVIMYGFKSFADKTEIDVKDGITAVIGPNGSGKSNIVDAIRWVLGEQSIKSLRGNKSQDIIFAGTQFRKSLGFTEVSIIFDNSDGEIPLNFQEVKVTRKLYRDGESGYYINGELSRLKTIQEIFMDTGIGKDGYSIIGQGRIEEILSNNSEERRKVFEEATGIVKYRERRKEALKNIEKTNENLLRVKDILGELEDRIIDLKAKSEKAQKYIEIENNKRKLDLRLFKETIGSLKQRKEDIEKFKKVLEEEIYKLNNENEKIEKNILEQKEALEKIDKENEDSYKKLGDITDVLKENERNIKVNEERIIQASENIKRNEEEIAQIDFKLGNVEEELKAKESKIEGYVKGKEEFIFKLQDLEKRLSEEKSKANTEIEMLKKISAEIEELEQQKYEKENEIIKLGFKLEKEEEKLNNIKELGKEYIRGKDRLVFEIEEKEKAFLKENSGILKVLKTLEDSKEEIEQLEKKHEERIKNQKENEKTLALLKNKIELFERLEKEKDGFTFAVKKIIDEKEKNTAVGKKALDVLADVITVDKKYTQAIETALGYTMQNILVEAEEDAESLIEYLKNEKAGKATFLPLTKFLKENKENIEKDALNKASIPEEIYILAKDIVKTKEKYKRSNI